MSKQIFHKELPIEFLIRGQFQPRRIFNPEALQELAASIKEHGLIEPIIVRAISEKKYEIIAGERRWRAAQMAGLDAVRCEIRELGDEEVAALTIIENVQRENLNPIEEARAYQRLIDEFGYIHEEVAGEVGKSRSKITNMLRLLNLDESIQDMLLEGKLSEAHGKVLAGLSKDEQRHLARYCLSRNWSTRKLEQEAKRLQQKVAQNYASRDPNLKAIENALSEHFCAKVAVDFDGVKGKLEIDWDNIDILQGILQRMGFEYEK